MSKIAKIFEYKTGQGIVEKINGTYIKSNPELLENLNHGDLVVCIKSNDYSDIYKGFSILMDLFKLKTNPEQLSKSKMERLDKEIEEFKKSKTFKES